MNECQKQCKFKEKANKYLEINVIYRAGRGDDELIMNAKSEYVDLLSRSIASVISKARTFYNNLFMHLV